jgi:hypothetical protein
MSGGAVSGNTASDQGGGVEVWIGTFTMSGGAVSGNTNSYGGGVHVADAGIFTMSGGAVSGNTASYGGGVHVSVAGIFTLNGGAVSGNTVSDAGGGVWVYNSGTFTMNGGAVSGNILSGSGYGKEVAIRSGAFKMSGEARPERVFLHSNSWFITVSGPLGSWTTPIDLGISGSSPLTDWENKPILQLDASYGSGNLASLKDRFTLGNSTLTGSPYTETAITGYRISDNGHFVRE